MPEATLTIRTARPADLGAVDSLFASSYARLLRQDYPPSVLVTALPLIARAQPRLLSSGSYYVAVAADGAVLAAGGWTWGGPQGPARQGWPMCAMSSAITGICGRASAGS
jgi:hypothetical protein